MVFSKEDLISDLSVFAENAPIKIKAKKAGAPIIFRFNQPQIELHATMERQLKEIGKCRILILKARQIGFSTYIGARNFWKSSTKQGTDVFILTHRADATKELFNKVKLMHNNVNPEYRATTSYSNTSELIFSKLNSSYSVGTSKSGDVGRSKTIHLCHLSECSYYASSSDEIKTGLLQTISNEPGTEIVMETTARGRDSFFYDLWMKTQDGDGDYINIFFPWFSNHKYKTELPIEIAEDFSFNEEEEELVKRYNLSKEQIYWRRQETNFMGKSLFQREYPATPEEAFSISNLGLFDMEKALGCQNKDISPGGDFGKTILSCDPARKGDRTVITIRKGRYFNDELIIYKEMDETNLSLILDELATKNNVEEINVDASFGSTACDLLKYKGHGNVNAVHFSEPASDILYLNKRAEMYGRLAFWINRGDCRIPTYGTLYKFPGDSYPETISGEEVLRDLGMIPDFLPSDAGKLKIRPKELIIKEFRKSPDIVDAMALSFYNENPKSHEINKLVPNSVQAVHNYVRRKTTR